jgi:hypothetical protein
MKARPTVQRLAISSGVKLGWLWDVPKEQKLGLLKESELVQRLASLLGLQWGPMLEQLKV